MTTNHEPELVIAQNVDDLFALYAEQMHQGNVPDLAQFAAQHGWTWTENCGFVQKPTPKIRYYVNGNEIRMEEV
jgi:hypothetical protein